MGWGYGNGYEYGWGHGGKVTVVRCACRAARLAWPAAMARWSA